MHTSKLSPAIRARALLVATTSAFTLLIAGCGGSDSNSNTVANDPVAQTPVTDPVTDPTAPVTDTTTPPVVDTTPATGTDGTATGGTPVSTTSQFCDEGTAGTVPAQAGDPAIDSVAQAIPGSLLATLQGVSCTTLGVEGSDPQPATRSLSMDRANLSFSVNGDVVVAGADAFRWVDSREYCAKPTPVSLADGSVLEIVAKFRADNNVPTYYRQKTSQADGARISQIECLPAPSQ